MLLEEGVALCTAAELFAEEFFAEEGEGGSRRVGEGVVIREVGFGFFSLGRF